MQPKRYIERDISWLSFNHRVLQEAADPAVPLYERLKFLGIYSSNLDEFFRVRVASLRSFKKLRRKTKQQLHLQPKKSLREIREIVEVQQAEFGRIFRDSILPDLARQGIFLITEKEFDPAQQEFASKLYDETISPLLHPTWLTASHRAPFLKNKGLYFVLDLETPANSLVVLEIPSEQLGRFIVLPASEDRHCIAFLDDIIRYNVSKLLPTTPIKGVYAIKLSRDAEIYLEEDLSGNIVDKIKQGLAERPAGLPTRLLYDSNMPPAVLELLCDIFSLKKNDLVPGARYHNFNDLMQFPDPTGNPALRDEPLPPLPHPTLERRKSLLEAALEEDHLLHYPYQKFDYVPGLIREAAGDPDVHTLKITLYRIGDQSEIAKALLEALEKGKKVLVFVEAKARFDEAANIYWGQALHQAGARVLYSFPHIKVHTKLLLIQQIARPSMGYFSTGNFNEKTARLYADHALLTSDQRLTAEADQVFQLLEGAQIQPVFNHLLVAPVNLRGRFLSLLEQEIQHARAGRPAYVWLKMNSLEDPLMVDHLYRAAAEGVQIRLIVRGICSIVPGPKIEAISIVDRFLEHARVYIFGNGGEELYYLASADWMTRNLDRRVEVAFPVYKKPLQEQIRREWDLQWRDNTKARILDPDFQNRRRERPAGDGIVRAQVGFYHYLTQLKPVVDDRTHQ